MIDDRDIGLDGTIYAPHTATINQGGSIKINDMKNRKFDLDASQKIIDKALAEGMGPEDFRGEDYPSKIELDEYYKDFGKENSEPPPCDDTDFDPNHDVEEVDQFTKIANKHDYPPIVSPEEEKLIKKFYNEYFKINNFYPNLKSTSSTEVNDATSYTYNPEDAWIQTYSGKKFYPLSPSVDSIAIEDIAKSLSQQCRFTGHCRFHYSIAQHSVAVSYLCEQKYALQGLLHDGGEAYIADIATPIKRLPELEQYKKIEKNIQFHIYKKFNVDLVEHPSVKEADTLMLATEAKSLLVNIHPDWTLPRSPLPFEIKKMTPEEAEILFLERFYEVLSI